MDLKGKTALVTGGARGIGKAIAIKLAEAGANIVINYSGSVEAAKETVEQLQALGVSAMSIKADVSKLDQVESLMDEVVKNYDSIDILVNNAGITKDTLIMRMTEEDFDTVITINLKGTFNCIKAATKYMIKKRSGKIVNISSVVGVIGNAGQANYSASKAGIIGLTKSAARELCTRNINVNAIAPGFIATDMTSELPEKIKNEYMDKIPFKRFGSAEDIAKAAVFLSSEMSDYITGQVINVDGGMVM
ncbi:3-oxoacyl-[acyl-carrier-protein] reductase FabG [Oxobacter pfennigii]|uniref:3-oxoacyl-[acyl-carrier-protein] reductase n=1 Tax=Oxobacter pfennigii TaxID=36849 RepID=A0A0P8WZM0_9CLOT|nr:3-oxoacyl-[acyl-carrier-protein] reductase [Oxobacter pfennigii]KPU43945.1 3-oxoacyl-[acyl-carrier-protein] reductase FabG [Oxobacter pfennigii]